jgi:hypothetical protein
MHANIYILVYLIKRTLYALVSICIKLHDVGFAMTHLVREEKKKHFMIIQQSKSITKETLRM